MTRNETIYLAGPMRGIELYNFPAFHETSAELRRRGFNVLCPAEHDEFVGFDPATTDIEDFDLEAAMKWDIGAILDSDIVVVLPGWRTSSGVAVELTVARAIGVPILEWPTLLPIQDEAVTEEAYRLVHGSRNDDYGHPFHDFTRTGRIWGAILGIDDVDPALVALCMIGVKMSREVNRPKRDNRVDIGGYTETLDMVCQWKDT